MTQEFDLQTAQLILDLNKEGDRLWGGLKHSNISIYIDKVLSLFQDKGLPAAVIIIDNIHPNRAEDIRKVLRDRPANYPYQVRIGFIGGGELVMGCKKKDDV